jgi:hypothetical protein
MSLERLNFSKYLCGLMKFIAKCNFDPPSSGLRPPSPASGRREYIAKQNLSRELMWSTPASGRREYIAKQNLSRELMWSTPASGRREYIAKQNLSRELMWSTDNLFLVNLIKKIKGYLV